MLRNILDITGLYLKTTYSNRTIIIFQFIMPIVFTMVNGAATSGFGPSDTTFTGWPIVIANEDAGEWGDTLVAKLEADPALAVQLEERAVGIEAVEAETAVAALTIPSNFSEQLLANEPIPLDFHINGDELIDAQPVEEAVNAALTQLNGSFTAATVSQKVADQLGLFDSDVDPNAYFAASVLQAESAWQSPPVMLTVEQEVAIETTADDIPNGVDQSSPGMMVMFAMFTMLGGAVTLIQEREQGTLRRLLVMPIRKTAVIGGKLLGVFITGIIQIVILIVFGSLIYDVPWGQSPLALVLLILSFAFAITSLGMLMAAVARTLAQSNSMNTIVVLSMASLGGAWWPIDIVPSWMQTLGLVFPTGWAMQGFHDIITRGLGVTAVLPEVAILIGYGILFLAIGNWRFKYE